jgi:DNA-binding transcriptional ArsR family regulator
LRSATLPAGYIVEPNYERMNIGIAEQRHVANIHGYTTQSPMKIDYLNVKKAALVLRALNHKLRQQILRLLEENQKMTVTDIYVQLRLEQSVASQHLAILRRAGIVKTERDGKYIYYRINEERLQQINHLVEDLLK